MNSVGSPALVVPRVPDPEYVAGDEQRVRSLRDIPLHDLKVELRQGTLSRKGEKGGPGQAEQASWKASMASYASPKPLTSGPAIFRRLLLSSR